MSHELIFVCIIAIVTSAIVIFLLLRDRPMTVHFASSPSVEIEWVGSAIQPWPNLELAIRAALDVFAAEYATYPALQRFRLEIFGANDVLYRPGQIQGPVSIDSDGSPRTLLGTTQRVAGLLGIGGTMIVRIRQMRARAEPLDMREPHVVRFFGAIVDPDQSALWDELACRLTPQVTEGDSGGYFEPWMTLRSAMRTRYYELRQKAESS